MRQSRSTVVGAVTCAALLSGVLLTEPAQARPDQISLASTAPVRSLTSAERAVRIFDSMSEAERVGQLFMAGVPSKGPSRTQLALLRKYRIGNVYLAGDTSGSRARVKATTKALTKVLSRAGTRPFVSVDQEGGQVQRLTGRGFARMPSALKQGKMRPSALRVKARTWGGQLAAAGINLDLAPVADTVPYRRARSNQPIGRYEREYGHTPTQVSTHVVAFTRGMDDAGVATAVKHFPGLGRATGNTDLKRRVTDPTSRHNSYVVPFHDAIAAGAPFVMVSSATYPKIDPKRRACFSSTVMSSMLRGDLGFRGVVMSDDLAAVALAPLSNGTRATRFLGAGGTMVLDTSTAPMPAMTTAVRARMSASTAFSAKIRAAVLTVLVAKIDAGLIG